MTLRVFPAVLVLLVALGAATVASGSPPAGFYESVKLEPAAAFVARKPVTVWCAKTASSWHAFLIARQGRDDGAPGATMPGASETFLGSEVCFPLKLDLSGTAVRYLALGPSVETLTHESIHARGESNEGVTDCDAVHEMPRVAVLFFHVKAGKQLRALMAAVWTWRALAGPTYRSVC